MHLLMCVDVQRSVDVSRTLQDLYEDRDSYVVVFVLISVSFCI